jgi:hypothetical protein
MRFCCVLTLGMAPHSAPNGVCVAKGRITRFSSSGRRYAFRFEQTDDMPDLIGGCRQFDVDVLGPASRNDPAPLLMNAHATGTDIEFGYLGTGLLRVGRCCLFLSSLGQGKVSDDRDHRAQRSLYFLDLDRVR